MFYSIGNLSFEDGDGSVLFFETGMIMVTASLHNDVTQARSIRFQRAQLRWLKRGLKPGRPRYYMCFRRNVSIAMIIVQIR
jgi:hypothetical protein